MHNEVNALSKLNLLGSKEGFKSSQPHIGLAQPRSDHLYNLPSMGNLPKLTCDIAFGGSANWLAATR